jgi:hypothetical protein
MASGADGQTPLHFMEEDLPLLARERQNRTAGILAVSDTDDG